jgi:uncharacterized alkaline shock family protein YloU
MALEGATLPCGVDLDTLIAEITDAAPPPDPAHQARCPHCQTALRALLGSWSDLQTLARAPVPVPPGLTARVMGRVRDLAHRAAEHLIFAHPRGQTQISHHVVAQVARSAALAVPGVLFASAIPQAPEPAGARTARVAVTVRLVTSYGPALTAVAAAVRSTLEWRLSRLLGAEVDRIDVTFTDIAIPDS